MTPHINTVHDKYFTTVLEGFKEIRKEDQIMGKTVTPLKAIRLKCIDCSGYELKEVRKCQSEECPLFSLRMGRGSRSTLKQIRAFCMTCCNCQRDKVRVCPTVKCSLWGFRFGKRPKNATLFSKNLMTEGVLETNRVTARVQIGSKEYAINR